MQDRLVVTVVREEDLRSAPAWVHRMLEELTQGGSWHIDVYSEIKGGALTQYADVAVGESVMATGSFLPLLRWVSKDSIAQIARASAMERNLALGTHPCLITPEPDVGVVALWDSSLSEEMAWIMDVSMEVFQQLRSTPVHERLARCRELVPDCEARWKAALDQGLRAVSLL